MSSLLARFLGKSTMQRWFVLQGLVHITAGHHPRRSHRLFVSGRALEIRCDGLRGEARPDRVDRNQHCHRPSDRRYRAGIRAVEPVSKPDAGWPGTVSTNYNGGCRQRSLKLRTPWLACRRSWNCLRKAPAMDAETAGRSALCGATGSRPPCAHFIRDQAICNRSPITPARSPLHLFGGEILTDLTPLAQKKQYLLDGTARNWARWAVIR